MIIIHQQYPLVEVLLVLVLVWQNSIPNVISVVEKKLLLLYCMYYYYESTKKFEPSIWEMI